VTATQHFRVTAKADRGTEIASIDPRLFGSMIEHLGRQIYGGLVETWDQDAPAPFREDVADLVRELGVTTIRYPGGNFVSGYRWEDGVGPIASRLRRLDLAWHSTEPNAVGLHEMADWLRGLDVDLMLAVNLGTRGTAHALELLEYANLPGGTALSDQRRLNGADLPFDVRMWCLGNEMDGPWQLGHRDADEYGRLAARTARAMRQIDPELQLVVCGSSNAEMPTFGSWERTVLRHTYEVVDFISCHAYYWLKDGDVDSFLSSASDMDRFIRTVATISDEVRAELGSERQVDISFDEWNVWDVDRFIADDQLHDPRDWPEAPRLLEDRYTLLDAVVVGSLLNTLMRHADRVRHKDYLNLDEDWFGNLLSDKGIVVDVKGALRGKIKKHTYWSL
jgi:alpha-N-arabinofuranosidase